ncbi:MAG TPA: hypothetical protein VHM70_28560 [Polyangiaceae bacterium]|nr:hypothetical protein [Polyangiaceae bacterium]
MRFSLPCVVISLLSIVSACGGKADDGSTNTKNNDSKPSSGTKKPVKTTPSAGEDAGATQAADDEGTTPNSTDDDIGGSKPPNATTEPAGTTPPTTGTAIVPTATATPAGPPIATPPISKPPIGISPMPVGSGTPPADAPVPMDCMDESRTTSTGYCQRTMTCSNDYLSSYCSRQTDGTYACSCNSQYAYGNYILTGVDDTTACDSAIDLCKGGSTVEFGGDVTCLNQQQQQDISYCQIIQQCGTSAKLSDSVTALSYESDYSYCSDLGDGRLSCNCSTSTTSRTYEITGQGLDAACQTGLDLCSADAPAFTTDPTCTPSSRTDGTNQCQLQIQCTNSAAIADGVNIVTSDYQSSYCGLASDGTWSCSCSTSTTSMSFQLAADQMVDDRCSAVLDLCTSNTTPEPSGEISCETSYQQASGDYCNGQVTCTQNATVGDLQVGLNGALSTSCQRTGDGVWNCSCASATESVTYDVEADDGWAACTAASDSCPDKVAVVIGSNTGAMVGGGVARPPILK